MNWEGAARYSAAPRFGGNLIYSLCPGCVCLNTTTTIMPSNLTAATMSITPT